MARVLGIDPGTHRLGWGILDGTAFRQTVIACGCTESPKGSKLPYYLLKIADDMADIISEYRPDLLGIETLLFQKNVSTAISVAQARGVILLAAARESLPIVELAPNTVKSTVAGNGSAGKKEVERMVGLLLGIKTDKLLDDTTDALAVGIAALAAYKG